jgi:hypothetical protein
VITLDAGDTITLTNVSLSSLSASNFQFFSGATDTIIITGIPSDETLSAGTKNADGSWSLTPSNLSGLTLTAGEPIGYPTPVDVQTTITNPAGQGASSSEDTGVTVNALPPSVGVSVLDNLSTDPVTETRLNITAAPDDPDGGNDAINRVMLSNIPTGVTLSHGGVAIPVVGGDATIAGSSIGSGYEVDVTTPAGQTTDFTLGVTAFSDEPNSPEQSASTTQNIDVEHNSSTQTENFSATNQSIWTTGTAFSTEFKNFLGFTVGPDSGSKSLGFSFGGLTIAGVTIIPSFSVSQTFGGTIFLKSGFESDLNVNAGSFNGTLPYNVTLADTFNKTTDRLELDPSNSQLGGGNFNTVGPGGSFELDFILDAMARAFTNGSFGSTSFTLGPYNVDDTLLKKNSSTLSGSFDLPDGIGSVAFAWPQVNAAGNNPSPGTISGHATSNPIFTLNLDPIAIVLDAILGTDPFKGSLLDGHVNYTLLAATLAPAVDLKQAFNLSSSGLSGSLTNGTGTSVPFTFGSPVVLNDPTNTDFTFNLSPNAMLENDTTLGGLLTVGLRALAGQIKLTLFGTGPTVGFGPLIHPKTTFGPTTLFSLYDKNFAVNFNSQNVHFSIA